MRIGIVIPAVPVYSETFFTNKIMGLQAQGHTVVLFVNYTKQIEPQGYQVKVAPKLFGNSVLVALNSAVKLLYMLFFHFKRSRLLYHLDQSDGVGFSQRIKNIVSNSHILPESLDWLHFGFGTMAIHRENVAKAMGARMAVSFRGFDIGVYPIKNPGCYHRLWNKVTKIHVISDDLKKLLYQQGYQGQSEVIKITPAIDAHHFKREGQPLLTGTNKMITLARLHWKKGLEYTLEALALLKKEGIPFHYTLIGEGEEFERLKFAAVQLALEDEVTFKGKMAHEKIKAELLASEIYLQYSIQEGFCNAVLEAQGVGLLCIVSNAEGLTENVLDGETGWVVPKCDTAALAQKIKEVMQLAPSVKNSVSEKAQKRVAAVFSLEEQQQKFVRFYED